MSGVYPSQSNQTAMLWRSATIAEKQGATMLNAKAEQFLDQRGIDVEIAMQYGICSVSCPRGEPTGESDDWLAIPFYENEERVNIKYRRISEKAFSQMPGGKQIFWNRDALTDETLAKYPLIITEGEFDALAALSAGFPRVVSVPGGAPSEVGSAKHYCIDDAMDDLRGVAEIIIATDADEPGANLRDDLIARLGKARCKIAPYPKGCKDLNDALARYGVKGVRECIDRAQYVPVEGVYSLSDLPESPPLEPVRVESMGPEFREHIGICKGQVSIWTGWANRGKSTVLRQVMVSLARDQRWRIGVAPFEDDVRRTFVPDCMPVYLARSMKEASSEDRDRALNFLDQAFKFIQPREDGIPTVPWFLEAAEACVVRYGCDMIVLDPWTELDLQIGRDNPETEAIKNYLTAFTRFARRFNVHVAIIAHPRKPKEVGGPKDKLPDGYDISGSAHFVNKCHLGVTVHSDDELDDVTQIRVWKSKYKEIMGPTGDFYLHFHAPSRCFTRMSYGEYQTLKGAA